jgi:hypothetical protein
MFKSSPFSGLVPFRNGGNGSMPSIGTSLTAALAGVERAEQALEAARALARSVARREGKSVRHLFGESRFISRASGERWADQAREEGMKAGCDIIVAGLTLDASPPFQHLVARLKRPGALREQQQQQAGGVTAVSKAEAILAAAARARSDGANERPEPDPESVAGQILAAAKKAHRRQGED